MLVAALIGFARKDTWSFPLIAFFAVLAPSSSIVPLADNAVEHRMYLPLAFCVVLAVGLVIYLIDRMPAPARALRNAKRVRLLLVVLLGSLTALRNTDYRTEIGLWSLTSRQQPQSWRAAYNLGTAHMKSGQNDTAIPFLLRSTQLRPQYPDTWANLGAAYLLTGEQLQAIAAFRQTLVADPQHGRALANLGMTLAKLGREEEALPYLRSAASNYPAASQYIMALIDRLEGSMAADAIDAD